MNAAFCLLIAVLLTAAHLLQYLGHMGSVLPSLRVSLLILTAFVCQRTLMSAGAERGMATVARAGLTVLMRFAGVKLMILLPVLVLGLSLTIPDLGRLVPTGWFLSFMMLMVVLYGASLVLLGTALPEIASTGRVRLSRAFDRGRRHYRAITRAMIFGPWLFGAAFTIAKFTAEWSGLPVVVTGDHPLWMVPVWLIARVVESGGHVLSTALVATVLCMAYRRVEAVS